MKHARFSLFLFFILGSLSAASGYTLFNNGRSQYVICLNIDAATPERTAAVELQTYLKEISGALLPIKTGGEKLIRTINISTKKKRGNTEANTQFDESFTYESRGENIHIYGYTPRGTMYGVYAFLENELGVRWYAPDCTYVPQRKKWTFTQLSHHEQPALRYRFVQYYHADLNKAWCAHNCINTLWSTDRNKYGGMEAYWSAHTMTQFVAPAEYFNTHPEYFALRNGKRISNGQLCLTNPKVLQICTQRLLDAIEKHPDYFAYSLSQADNEDYCQCKACTKLVQKYGAQSGVVLWFVNQVADVVRQHYPDKYVGTFAYRYTRSIPKGIQPRQNVIIRLCNIECCFAHPLEAQCNKDFINDMKAWGSIAPQLFIWDYVINFQQYMAPFPNFSVLASNIKTFRDNKAIGIHEEGQYETDGGEFAELRAWVLAKLLWNPEQDTYALVNEFIKAYYGKAASYIQQYFDLVQNLVRDNHHFGIYIRDDNALYTEAFLTKGKNILDKALKAAGNNDTIVHRVETVQMQLMYLHTMRKPQEAAVDGTANKLFERMRKHNYRAGEGVDVETFINRRKKIAAE